VAALSYLIDNAAGGVFLVGALLHGDPVMGNAPTL
jgi:hypothetical protein